MLNLDFPRDLVTTGAIFGVATMVWAGWAQESPPARTVWRVVLGILSVAGLALAAVSIPAAIQNWGTPSAITPGNPAFIVYVIVFWAEVLVCIGLAIWAVRAGRKDLIAPLILLVVGIHFIPLAFVFGQPVMAIAGAVLAVIAVVAALMPRRGEVARSFWCGILTAPVLLAVGAWCTIAAYGALGA